MRKQATRLPVVAHGGRGDIVEEKHEVSHGEGMTIRRKIGGGLQLVIRVFSQQPMGAYQVL